MRPLVDRPNMSFEEIGAKLGVTKQAAHETYRKAIIKLAKVINENYPEIRTERRVLEDHRGWLRNSTIKTDKN